MTLIFNIHSRSQGYRTARICAVIQLYSCMKQLKCLMIDYVREMTVNKSSSSLMDTVKVFVVYLSSSKNRSFLIVINSILVNEIICVCLTSQPLSLYVSILHAKTVTDVMCKILLKWGSAVFLDCFFSFVRWKLQSPWWRWQCIASPSGFRTACGLRECGLARFPFWVARRWGRTAVDILLSDCQYCKGTVLYANAEFGIQVIVEAVVACPEPEHCYLFPSG